MIPETPNPTHAGGVVGLGILKAVAADDTPRFTPLRPFRQVAVVDETGLIIAIVADIRAARGFLREARRW
jgi:hypothetical protein